MLPTSRSRVALFLLLLVVALLPMASPPLVPSASAVIVLSPNSQPFDFSNQVRNRWNGVCDSYTRWGSPWFVQAPECDRYLLADATSLRAAGFDIREGDGSAVEGLTLFRDGLSISTPGGPPQIATDGWDMLAMFDTDGDGRVSSSDGTWGHLRLFNDANGNSDPETGEVEDMSLVSSIGTTGSQPVPDPLGNVLNDGEWEDAAGIPQPATDVVFAELEPFTYGGLSYYAQGAASLSTTPQGRLKISNLGSSGCDGYSISFGGGGGGTGGTSEFPAGATVRPRHDGWTDLLSWSWGRIDHGGGGTSKAPLVEYVILVGLIARATVHDIEITPPGDVTTGEVVASLDGQVVATKKTYDYLPMSSLDRASSVSASSECSPSSSSGPPYPCVETGAITLEWDAPTSLTIPGLPAPVTVDRVTIVGENASTDVSSGVCHVDVEYEDAPAGAEAETDLPGLSLHGVSLSAVDQALMSSSGGRLKISNLGSSGCDGVSIDLGDDDLTGLFNLVHPAGVDPSGYLELQAHGSLAGNPNTLLGSLRFAASTPDRLTLNWDYSAVGAQNATIELYADGDPVQTYQLQAGPIFVLSPPTPKGDASANKISPGWPSGCGKELLPPFVFCFIGEWPDLRQFQVPGQAPVLADEIRVLANGQPVDSLDRVSLMARDIPGGEFDVESVRNSLSGDPDFDITRVRATGQSSVRRTGRNPQTGKEIKISNLGSSGCDGFSIDLDPSATVLAVDMELPLAGTTPAPTGTVSHGTEDINIGVGELQECTISKAVDTDDVSITPDLSGIGGTNLRLRLWRNNVLRVEVPIQNGQEACSIPEWPSNFSVSYETNSNGEPVCYLRYKLTNVMVSSYSVSGNKGGGTAEIDFIEIAGDVPALPASIGSAFLRASDLPYLHVTAVPGGGSATTAPTPSRHADVLHPNAPNPFNPATQLRFTLSRPGKVELAIFGIDGRRVDTLVSGEMNAGEHAWMWSGTDAQGRGVASGTYFVQLRTEDGTQSRKIALVK